MRLDKFLKLSRIIKRRTIAAEACDGGRVKVNGKTAKPGHTLKSGDALEIAMGASVLRIRIKKLPEHEVRAGEADEVFEAF